MTLRQLKIFDTVFRHLNVTKASRELRISQPSVSKQLKSLQECCGVKLYKKIGRRIELTNEGRLFQAQAREVLSRLESLAEKYSGRALFSDTKSLVIGGSHGPSVSLLPWSLAVFKKRNPLVNVTLRTRSSQGIERLILDSEVEIGVVTNLSNPSNLCVETCRRERLVPFASTEHPMAKKKQLSLEEFARLPLIVKKKWEAKTRQILKQIEEQGFKANILMECESAEAVKLATLKRLGVGILYQDHVSREVKQGKLKILKIKGLKQIDIKSYVIRKNGTTLSAYAQDFRDLLLNRMMPTTH